VSLVNLFNLPKTQDEWNIWSFSNADHHRQIIAAIGVQKSVRLNEFILDPIPFHDLAGWVYNHQSMHNDMDGVLSIAGFDLTGLDPQNEGQVAAWIRLHAIEHQSAALSLGI
jgi:hypothetical protein